MRRVHIGLLGFGCIGRATVRAAESAAPWIEATGLSLEFARALVRNVDGRVVRDVRRGRSVDRPCQESIELIDDPRRFLAGEYDVVIEALGGVEPARTLVTALLERGTPVVTANKSLLAAAGEELAAAAARGRTSLRYEASALAGVPFIGALGGRPLARAIERIAAIVNGTSNYILSSMEADRLSFCEALGRAQALGLAEPDPRADIEGRDAAEKLVLLLRHLGVASIRRDAIETTGIAGVEESDLQTARTLGGRVKPVVHACLDRRTAAIEAFVGPAFVEGSDALSTIDGPLNGIRLDGRFVRGLFFSGPGAGPDVTAATILDDVVEAIREGTSHGTTDRVTNGPVAVSAPSGRWFLRLAFASRSPDRPDPSDLLASHGVSISRTVDQGGDTFWALTNAAPRGSIDAALRSLEAAGAARTLALRVLEA